MALTDLVNQAKQRVKAVYENFFYYGQEAPAPRMQDEYIGGQDPYAQPAPAKKRSKRKIVPTIHDIDKAYALMAQVKAQAQAEDEMIEAKMAAYGYIPVMQEDGTIVYINEQTNFIAYEE